MHLRARTQTETDRQAQTDKRMHAYTHTHLPHLRLTVVLQVIASAGHERKPRRAAGTPVAAANAIVATTANTGATAAIFLSALEGCHDLQQTPPHVVTHDGKNGGGALKEQRPVAAGEPLHHAAHLHPREQDGRGKKRGD